MGLPLGVDVCLLVLTGSESLTRIFCLPCSQALDSAGSGIEVAKYTEKLVPSTRFVSVDGIAPVAGSNNFIAPSASVIGNVSIGEHSRYVDSSFLREFSLGSLKSSIHDSMCSVFGMVQPCEAM